VTVEENTDKQFHLVLPPVPSSELSEDDLEAAAGGVVTGRRLDRILGTITAEM